MTRDEIIRLVKYLALGLIAGWIELWVFEHYARGKPASENNIRLVKEKKG